MLDAIVRTTLEIELVGGGADHKLSVSRVKAQDNRLLNTQDREGMTPRLDILSSRGAPGEDAGVDLLHGPGLSRLRRPITARGCSREWIPGLINGRS